jgi:PAP_fibrillin
MTYATDVLSRILCSLVSINSNANRTLKSPAINGRWTLIYTTSASILGKNLPAPLRSVGPIYQWIDVPTLTARNEEYIKPLPFVSIIRAVNAELEPVK